MKILMALILLLPLAGCGSAETAATAASVAAGEADAAKNAQQTKQQLEQKLNAATQLETQRLKEQDAQTQ